MDCFIGIDIGTSSTKSILMRADGHIYGAAQIKYDVLRPYPGYAEQDTDVLWQATRKTLQDLSARFPEECSCLRCIGFSGQMHALVMLDARGRLIRNAIIWEDQRSVREVDELKAQIPGSEFCKTTLNTLSTGFLISSLLWVRRHEPENYARMHRLLMIKDYIRYKMCGEIACEMSDASSSAIFDISKRDWAWLLIDRLELPREIFPPCYEAYQIAGYLRNDIASDVGLLAGIPMIYGGGDTLMHEVGTGMIDENRPWVANIGTSCQVSCAMNEPRYDRLLRTNTFCHVKESLWMQMSCNLCGGAAMKWLRDMIFSGLSFEELNHLAELVPAGSDGLIFLPYLSGARSPENDPKARGMFMGLALSHSKNHMIRATMEGVVYSLKCAYGILRDVNGHEPEYIIASGGGARGELLLQMQADAFDKPIYTTVEAEQSCIGAAISAAVGIGFFKSFFQGCDEIVRFNRRIVEPIAANVRKYNAYFEIYSELYDRNKELFARYPQFL